MLSQDEALWSALVVLRFRPLVLQLRRLSQKGRREEEGRPVEAALGEEMKQLLGCDFRDVRIYDDRKAEEMARQLGAEAFTMGKKIFAPKGKLDATTLAGKALLAHELSHVARETQHANWAAAERPLPIWEAIQPAAKSEVPRAAAPGRTAVGASLLQEAKEREAQAVERMVRESGNTMPRRREQSNPKAAEIDPEDIADRVYDLMQSELILERERARI